MVVLPTKVRNTGKGVGLRSEIMSSLDMLSSGALRSPNENVDYKIGYMD